MHPKYPTNDSVLLDDALDDIVTGVGVHRSKHELIVDGTGVAERFLWALQRNGYLPTRVEEVNVKPGERIPAFFMVESTAYFGWVFWGKFSQQKSRKLWGSEVKNAKGDWAIQLPPGKACTIYANSALKLEMDIENPR